MSSVTLRREKTIRQRESTGGARNSELAKKAPTRGSSGELWSMSAARRKRESDLTEDSKGVRLPREEKEAGFDNAEAKGNRSRLLQLKRVARESSPTRAGKEKGII